MKKEIITIPFGELISGARKLKGWTIKEVIDQLTKVGPKTLSPAYITRIEQYGEIPSPDLIMMLAGILDLDPQKLIICAKETKLKKMDKILEEKYSRALSSYNQSKKKK